MLWSLVKDMEKEGSLVNSALKGLGFALENWIDPFFDNLSLKDDDSINIALQLPAGLIRYHREFIDLIESSLGSAVSLYLKPTYGSCDIPYFQLMGLGYTHLIHVGHSPIRSLGSPIPTLFVPVHIQYDDQVLQKGLDDAVDAYSLKGKKVCLVTTIQYSDGIGSAYEYLKKQGMEVLLLKESLRADGKGQILGCNFQNSAGAGVKDVIYIGTGLFHPRGVAINGGHRVIKVNPHTGKHTEVDGRDFLKKRAALALSLSEKKNFMIVCTSKSGQCRIDVAEELVELGKKRGYAVSMALADEIRPELFTGLGLECIVSTACPRIAYDDMSSYPVPVITPQEFRLAVGDLALEDFTIDELI